MTKGEYRVGINFNPSGDDMVGQIKRKAADLIDFIESIPDFGGENVHSDEAQTCCRERARLKALAQTDIETAAMHAVKAATKREPEQADD